MNRYLTLAVLFALLLSSRANATLLKCRMTDYSQGAIVSSSTATIPEIGLSSEDVIPREAVHKISGKVATLNDGEITGTATNTGSRIKVTYVLEPPNEPRISISYSYFPSSGNIVANALFHGPFPLHIIRVAGNCDIVP